MTKSFKEVKLHLFTIPCNHIAQQWNLICLSKDYWELIMFHFHTCELDGHI